MALDALAIEDTAECPNCGHQVLAKWAFCRHCGIALNALQCLSPEKPRKSGVRWTFRRWEPVTEPVARFADAASPVTPRLDMSRHVMNLERLGFLDGFKLPFEACFDPDFGWATPLLSRFFQVFPVFSLIRVLRKSPLHYIPAEAEKRITFLEQRVVSMTDSDAARLSQLVDQGRRLSEHLQQLCVAREIHLERRRKELSMLESNQEVELKRARGERQALEAKLQEAGQERLEEVRVELRKEQVEQGGLQAEYQKQLGEEAQRLHLLLKKQHAVMSLEDVAE